MEMSLLFVKKAATVRCRLGRPGCALGLSRAELGSAVCLQAGPLLTLPPTPTLTSCSAWFQAAETLILTPMTEG